MVQLNQDKKQGKMRLLEEISSENVRSQKAGLIRTERCSAAGLAVLAVAEELL
jgi:hypothetical protein